MATGFNFGGLSSTGTTGTVPGSGGFNFGTPAASASSGGFSLGGTAPAVSTLGTSGGFSLAVPGTTTSTANVPILGGLLGATATTSSGVLGMGLGTAVTTTGPSIGFSFPSASTAPTSTAPLGGLGGLSFNKPLPTLAAPSLGGLLATAASTVVGTGGLFGAPAATALPATTSIFAAAPSTKATIGLGGQDLKTLKSIGGSAGSTSKTSDGKALRETEMPALIVETVTTFTKHVKDERSVREDISRMSTKPLFKVQEDTAALKQLLAVVSTGLQRNACAVDKLKREMAQELKNAEMAQRTKDIPQGLQYENTAPSIYFQMLVEDFEGRMITYRQQIDTLENHLAVLHQPTRHTPSELISLMKKLHETFIALAAQLQVINEAVKTQKEHYLNYRKIFHGDTKNIFERHPKPAVVVAPIRPLDHAGPTPFTGMTNATAAAMASVLNRAQQPAGAPPVAGLTSSTLGSSGLGIGGPALGTTTGLFSGSNLASSSGNTSQKASSQYKRVAR